jgi:hypothetical protein
LIFDLPVLRTRILTIDAANPGNAIRGTKLAPITEGATKLVAKRNASGRRSPSIGTEITGHAAQFQSGCSDDPLSKSIGVDFFEAWSVNEISSDD